MHDLPTHHANLLDRIDAMPDYYAIIAVIIIIVILVLTRKNKTK